MTSQEARVLIESQPGVCVATTLSEAFGRHAGLPCVFRFRFTWRYCLEMWDFYKRRWCPLKKTNFPWGLTYTRVKNPEDCATKALTSKAL